MHYESGAMTVLAPVEEHSKHEFLIFLWTNFNAVCIVRTATINYTCLSILVEICREMTILRQVEIIVIFMPYFQSIAFHTVWTVIIAQI